jgi:hypothetical protein
MAVDDLFKGIGNAVSKTIGGIFDPAGTRRKQSGIPQGAELSEAQGFKGGRANIKGENTDWRVKITLLENQGLIDSNGLLSPLVNDGGVVFPYTPNITISHSAHYEGYDPIQNNYRYHAYSNSTIDNMTIPADFTAQNESEARYLLAAFHFFRTVTKSFYGNGGAQQGNPPPVCNLNAYGYYIFNNVPIIVTNFTTDFRQEVDYISVDVSEDTNRELLLSEGSELKNIIASQDSRNLPSDSGSRVWVPSLMTMTVQVMPAYSRQTTRQFSLQGFARGDNINKGFI